MSRISVAFVVLFMSCAGPESPGESGPVEAREAERPGAENMAAGHVSVAPRVDDVKAPLALVVSRFSPQQGAVGARVVLDGSGFSSRPHENRVLFGSERCGVPAMVLSASEHSLDIEVPEFATTTTLTVIVGSQRVMTVDPFVVSAPVLSAVDPSSVLVGSALTPVTLAGDGFGDSTAVTLDGVELAVTERTPTRVTALVNARLTKLARVGQLAVVGASTTLPFVIENPAPGEATVTPAIAHSRVTELRVASPGAVPVSVVLIDHQPVPTRWDEDHLVAQLPGLAPGPHLVMVHTPAPGGGTGAAATLTVAP